MNNLANLNVVKMASIQDVVNAVQRVLKSQINLKKLLQKRNYIFLNGKRKIEKKDLNKAEVGILEIWKKLVKCLWKLQKNISVATKVKKREMKDHLFGIKIILKKEGFMIEQCMQSKQEKLLDQTIVQNALKFVNLKLIMKTIQNLTMSFGYVLNAISIYIINQNITVREQARKLCKQMRCSDLSTKARDLHRNDVGANLSGWLLSNSMWQAGGKAKFIYLPPGYNNDPLNKNFTHVADLKPFLIDLEAYGEIYGDKAQATERCAA
jgi:hypothetical protein